jgi:CubicO group peptidase (beta-lactamase class C family)
LKKAIVPGRAVGYRWPRQLEHAEPLDPINCGASGGVRYTAIDLVRSAQALMRPGLLKEDTRRQMFDAPPGGYGLGCYVSTIGAQRLVDHPGGFGGFSTYVAALPDSNQCAVVLCNIERTRTIDLGHAILRASMGEQVRDNADGAVGQSSVERITNCTARSIFPARDFALRWATMQIWRIAPTGLEPVTRGL